MEKFCERWVVNLKFGPTNSLKLLVQRVMIGAVNVEICL